MPPGHWLTAQAALVISGVLARALRLRRRAVTSHTCTCGGSGWKAARKEVLAVPEDKQAVTYVLG